MKKKLKRPRSLSEGKVIMKSFKNRPDFFWETDFFWEKSKKFAHLTSFPLWASEVNIHSITIRLHNPCGLQQNLWVIGTELNNQRRIPFSCEVSQTEFTVFRVFNQSLAVDHGGVADGGAMVARQTPKSGHKTKKNTWLPSTSTSTSTPLIFPLQ